MKHIDIFGLQPHQENIPTPSCHTQDIIFMHQTVGRMQQQTDSVLPQCVWEAVSTYFAYLT